MTIEKCIDEIKELELPFYLEPKRKEILQVVEELRNESLIYSKALDMMAEELAMNKHCKMFPNCYLESDQENCQLIKECHDKEWLKQYYIEKVREQ